MATKVDFLTIPSIRTLILIVSIFSVLLASVTLALIVGAYGYKYRDDIRRELKVVQGYEILTTSRYDIRLEKLPLPGLGSGWRLGRDGGIAPLFSGLLYANRVGDLWYIERGGRSVKLPTRIPINFDAFQSDEYNQNTIFVERFSVRDLLAIANNDHVTVVASHMNWDSDRNCYSLRVSTASMSAAFIQGSPNAIAPDWQTAFETLPCSQLFKSGSARSPALEAGGRLAALSSAKVLLTTGRLDYVEGGQSISDSALDPNNHYGKTILIDLENNSFETFTVGHRNAQGLEVTDAGLIWSTEHGPQGGDELNLLERDAHYGWPHVTYGTEYGAKTFNGRLNSGRHVGYTEPRFAWVPSIGISQLISVVGTAFQVWTGDLIISALEGQGLFRVVLDGTRVVLVEPLPLPGHRVRDIIELADGTIALKTDKSYLLLLTPLDLDESLVGLDSTSRGAVIASRCRGCHSVEGSKAGLGPPLAGIMGRKIASYPEFQYTDALSQHSGRWTDETMREFLSSPQSFAPGTSMVLPGDFRAEQLEDLIQYLKTL